VALAEVSQANATVGSQLLVGNLLSDDSWDGAAPRFFQSYRRSPLKTHLKRLSDGSSPEQTSTTRTLQVVVLVGTSFNWEDSLFAGNQLKRRHTAIHVQGKRGLSRLQAAQTRPEIGRQVGGHHAHSETDDRKTGGIKKVGAADEAHSASRPTEPGPGVHLFASERHSAFTQ